MLFAASQTLPEVYLKNLELEPWDLTNLVPYDSHYLSGFKAEVSELDIGNAFEVAKSQMESVIEWDIHNDIGGDKQIITDMHTQYDRTTYKYTLLPAWLRVFCHGKKVYHFVINARTGEV
jgi:hypothetical protein